MTIVRSGHYSADGDEYDYYDSYEGVEIVSSNGSLVNPVTVQVCTHMIILMYCTSSLQDFRNGVQQNKNYNMAQNAY